MSKAAIIVGASSGIGKGMAELLSQEGYRLGLAARRLPELEAIKKQVSTDVFIKEMDVTDTAQIVEGFKGLVKDLGTVDLVFISAGTGSDNVDLNPETEIETIDVNVKGFTVLADLAFMHFKREGHVGYLAGVSSIMCLRGCWSAPAYSASKAFMSNYLEGLRMKATREGLEIHVTDIRPGFVDTKMAQGDRLFWVAPVKKAVGQMYKAILKKKKCVYITKRWSAFAWLYYFLPDWLHVKL